ncbi:hypothetical protein BS47DRAFT_1391909 [Hydnum rufescens UP504]|uniref:Uncharacterized protein n=1 Tax=Hydnum rufescens UP504 TaxID=1448309 RepID=A0A9P6B024_9AGAM|nr:hypothetical protein BS47DRAFT_1391909 [Hydnum rufescens UP504]
MRYVRRTTKKHWFLPGISFYLIVSDARNSTGLTISTTAMKHFVDELERFLILRSKAQWDDVESGRWQQKDSPKVVECLKLESSLYNENDCYKDYVQDFDCLTDEDGSHHINSMNWTNNGRMPMMQRLHGITGMSWFILQRMSIWPIRLLITFDQLTAWVLFDICADS